MAVATFMDSPLVTWVRTFSAGESLDFHDLDAVYLYDVFTQIDERGHESRINRAGKDSNARIQNWAILLRDVLAFYQDVLQQFVVLELPDVTAIAKEPTKESSLRDLQKMLLLLLGCAVQSPGRENFIQAITCLDISTQQAIMEHIKQITDSCSVIVQCETLDLQHCDGLLLSMKTLIKERDRCSQRIIELIQERDYHKAEVDKKVGPVTPPASLEKHHLMRELSKYRTHNTRLTDDVEEKTRVLSELKDELALLKQERNKLKQENMVLSKDAKAARAYRDELDTLKEQALKADKLEREVNKYKDRLNELEFLKSRIEELREDNTLLSDGKVKLEEQVAMTTKRLESLLDDLVRLQSKLDETSQEKEQLSKKLQELVDENSMLALEMNSMREGGGGMRRFQSTSRFLTSSTISLASLASNPAGSGGNPISEELNETMLTRVSRLEMENDELRREAEKVQGELSDLQRHLEQRVATCELEYKNKADQLQLETSATRHKLSQELSTEYRVRFEANMQKQEEQMKRLMREHQDIVQNMKQREVELQKQVMEMRTALQQQHSDEKAAAREKSSQLQRELDTARLEKEETREEMEKYHKKLLQAHKYAESMKKERDSAQQAMTHIQVTTQAQINDLQGKVKDLQKVNDQLQESYSQLSSQNGYDSGIDESRHSPKATNPSAAYMPGTPPARAQPGLMHPDNAVSPRSGGSGKYAQQFDRVNPLRITITPMRQPPNFSRDHRLRQSMPDKKFMYRPPERRPQPVPEGRVSQASSRRSSVRETPVSSAAQTPSQSEQTTPTGSQEVLGRGRHRGSDTVDCSTPTSHCDPPSFDLNESLSSISSSTNGYSKEDKIARILRTLKITSTETITTKLKMFTKSEKTKIFIDKILELQDHNDRLSQENTELKKKLGSLRFSEDRVDRLEKKILELEAENQKLRKMLDIYNNYGNPNDSRTYHYYSNV